MNMEPKLYRMPPVERQKVISIIKETLTPIPEVQFAFLFGSFLDDQEMAAPFHDIDTGIFLKGTGKKQSIHFALDLSVQLTSLIKKPVDVRVLNFAPVSFLFHVVRGQLIVDKDEDARCRFMEWVVRHYLDMKPLLHRAIKEAYGE